MKKILALLAVAGAAVFLIQRRRQAAAAEAALWDEATGRPSGAGGYPGTAREFAWCADRVGVSRLGHQGT